jgi:hypothetical protein
MRHRKPRKPPVNMGSLFGQPGPTVPRPRLAQAPRKEAEPGVKHAVRHIPPRTMTLQQQYDTWKEEHPRAWDKAVELARKAASARPHYSSRDLVSALRWYSLIEWGDQDFKLNNNISPYLGRDLVSLGIVPPDFFEFRRVLDEGDAADQGRGDETR